ncbi:MAG TPA: protein translocase subunit SecD [Candidatus Paceibacterota bacterium]|nr:protein translocase subunit SecD [Candidatus Paceibacterota bacterium]HPC37308.1 protein translocase subunit SecD [Candidatus Paceibacterota bacterium]HRU35835.1 protein translocase subunit SecD [Candidatus Paceibacterota bacterium]
MKENSKNLLIVGIILVLSIVAGLFAYGQLSFLPNWFKAPYRLGLDLSGGTRLIYEADLNQVAVNDRESAMNGLRDVIERRVNLFGVSEPRVEVVKVGDSYRLSVELAGIKDINQAIEMIGETPYLEFREQRSEEETNKILEEQKNNNPEYLFVDPYFVPSEPQLTGQYLKSAKLDFDPNTYEPVVSLEFNEEGAKIFSQLTQENIGKVLAIYLDGQPISLPVVQEQINEGKAQITGKFTADEAKKLVESLNAGALPVPITLISQQSIGALQGEFFLKLSIKAGIIGLIVVIIFMIFIYGKLGLFASLALIIYTILNLTIFKLIPVTLSLSGIAGFILSIGMAVDANILIFERYREEIKLGLNKKRAIEEGFRRAWPSIRDSNVSSIITCLVLYNFTSSMVKGFSLTLLIGVLTSMFTAITISRSFLKAFIK